MAKRPRPNRRPGVPTKPHTTARSTQRASNIRRSRARSFAIRSAAAVKGWVTRRRNEEDSARKHGKVARERTEARLTPAQKAKRTRDANRIESGELPTVNRRKRESSLSLDDIYEHRADYDAWDEYDIETSPDYAIGGE